MTIRSRSPPSECRTSHRYRLKEQRARQLQGEERPATGIVSTRGGAARRPGRTDRSAGAGSSRGGTRAAKRRAARMSSSNGVRAGVSHGLGTTTCCLLLPSQLMGRMLFGRRRRLGRRRRPSSSRPGRKGSRAPGAGSTRFRFGSLGRRRRPRRHLPPPFAAMSELEQLKELGRSLCPVAPEAGGEADRQFPPVLTPARRPQCPFSATPTRRCGSWRCPTCSATRSRRPSTARPSSSRPSRRPAAPARVRSGRSSSSAATSR
jgi:hypothetical protein